MRARALGSGLVLLLALGLAPSARSVSAVPSADVTPWKPAGVSSPQFESHPAFDPLTGDFYFVRSSPSFEGWRILVAHCGPSGWSKPEPWALAADGFEADPWFTPDGHTLWFISSRSTDGVRRKDLDIWKVSRDSRGRWLKPERLPEPVNSAFAEWFPRPAPKCPWPHRS